MRVVDELQLTISFEPNGAGGYLARVEEVPGAVSEGSSREEAREMVLDALRELVLSHLERPEPVDGDHERIAVRLGEAPGA
ncbi:MAG: type II toxin-antitoxin system HicB family antitoxin [Solirubrobacterales bacterium]|nr:type II toxin-antitoxin system HicB family antitoxin [Solirubrobacterales bacterium]